MSKIVFSKILKSIPGILHSFGTMHNPVSPLFASHWSFRPKWKQVHGTKATLVFTPAQECENTDALWTAQNHLPIAIATADCVPILLAKKDGSKIAAVHAGWRGTQARILKSLWDELSSVNEKPEQWVAAIGPAIGPCCYEVSLELENEFLTKFLNPSIVPTPRHLDLPLINALELQKTGLQDVEILRECTFCSSTKYFSYRREKNTERQFSIIMRTES